MKLKMILIVFLSLAVVPATLSARGTSDEETVLAHPSHTSAAALENPMLTDLTTPTAAPQGPQQELQDYEAAMMAITQRFTATLASIVGAVQRGELSSEQGRKMSAEEYQVAYMQFEVLCAWREMLEYDVARVPAAPANPAPKQKNEIVAVALPFSSFQLSPPLAEYLKLNESQVQAIQQLMVQERGNLEPLMAQLRTTREKLLTARTDDPNEKEVKALAATQAHLVAKLIVANARMQSKIYELLNPEQRKKLDDFKRTSETTN